MGSIDDIIAGGAGASSRADFSGLGDIPKAYWEGKDQRAKNDLRDAFKGGVPLTPDGQPDFGSMAKTLFQKGGLTEGTAAANLGLSQQKMEFGKRAGESAFPTDNQPPPFISPPSASTPRLKEVAAPLNKGGVQGPGQSPQGDQPTVMKILAQHVPNDQLGAASASVMRQLADVAPGLSATDPIDVNDPRIGNVLRPAVAQIKRMGLGQVQPPQPGDGQPPQAAPQMAQPQMQPAQPDFNQRFNAARPGQGSDPTLGGLVPAGRTAQQQIAGLSRMISSGNLSPEQAKVYQSHIDAITKAIEPTGPMKEYDKAVSQGYKGTIEDWQNRTDDNTTQRDVLTKSTLPLIEKSREKATSSIEDIDAIHRARQELDQPGGAITGVWANDRLKLAKIGNYLGIANADKITNTESFMAAAGKRVAAMVKAFGSGTAISDGDRRFAEKMAGGGIELNETSIRRILDIGEQADRAIIGRHNEFADKAVKSNEGLKPARDTLIVQQPGQYKKSAPSADVFDAARKAIDQGAPRDAVMKRLRENGHNPANL